MISAFGSTHIGGANNNENQDTFFIGDHMFGVFDGHGVGGKTVAETACAAFAAASLDSSFPEIFAAAEEAVARIGLPVTHRDGGTTASCLYIDYDGYCQVGHVGDSEVRYYDDVDGVSLTADHSACSLEEFKRIKGTSDPSRFEFTARPPNGVARPVFVKRAGEWIMDPRGGNFYCTARRDWATYVVSPDEERLAVTRAIGDFSMKPYGVSAEPTITTVGPPAAGVTRAIVLASDGLWDAMTYDEVGAIVRRPDLIGNAEATTALMEAALAASNKMFGSSADNTTAIVVYMTSPDSLCTTPPEDLSLVSPPKENGCTYGIREGICKCCGSYTTISE